MECGLTTNKSLGMVKTDLVSVNSTLDGDCLFGNEAGRDKVRHVDKNQGQGQGSSQVSDVVNSASDNTFSNEKDFIASTNKTSIDDDSSLNIDQINCGFPPVSGECLRQSAIRVFKNQNGYGETEVILNDTNDWEDLPEFVGMTDDVSTCEAVAGYHNCGVPVYCIEIVPGSYVPVFHHCIAGICHCVYILQGSVTQLKPCRFAAQMGSFENIEKRDWFVLTGVCRGFRIIDKGCNTAYFCENYSSITKGAFKDEMTEKVRNELADGKIRRVSNKPRCVHSIGGVIKTDGSLRPITDCSSPEHININLYMDDSCDKFKYHSVDDVVDVLDQYDYSGVSDISSAYRSVNVLPSHREFQGFQWDSGDGDVWYTDLCLCFGLKSAPWIFTQISDFCVKCVHKEGVGRCVNYLDDFIVLSSNYDNCAKAQDTLHSVLRNLGFIISEKKVSKPNQVTKYLGIIIDSINMTLSIGDDKLERVINCVNFLRGKSWCSRKLLEQTAGLLAHCATVVRGGRTFTRRIYNLLRDTKASCSRIALTILAILDLKWWGTFISSFNGKARMFGKDCRVVVLTTDASSTGFGGYSEDDYYWGFWGDHNPVCGHQAKAPTEPVYYDNINVGELWPVLKALHRCAPSWRDCIIEVVTDNTQVYHELRTGRGSNPTTMAWLREIFWVTALHNIYIKPSWIRSQDNILADSLSRLRNSDCVTICADHIYDFEYCCRPHLIKRGLG